MGNQHREVSKPVTLVYLEIESQGLVQQSFYPHPDFTEKPGFRTPC
uniref:Uncharacterized protein n=1 Tax=Planktothrix agardhii TaxID=1160 RepID=A0A1J1JD58_PLAAG|nr:protein of unknown function [Planktothrix agardhii]